MALKSMFNLGSPPPRAVRHHGQSATTGSPPPRVFVKPLFFVSLTIVLLFMLESSNMVKAQYEDCDCCSLYRIDTTKSGATFNIESGLTCADIRRLCPKLNCPDMASTKDSGCTVNISVNYSTSMTIMHFRVLPFADDECTSPEDPWSEDNPCMVSGEYIPQVKWSSTAGGQATATFDNVTCSNPNSCFWACVQQIYGKPYPTTKDILKCLLDGIENELENAISGQFGKLVCL